jgi:hypothetical protein
MCSSWRARLRQCDLQFWRRVVIDDGIVNEQGAAFGLRGVRFGYQRAFLLQVPVVQNVAVMAERKLSDPLRASDLACLGSVSAIENEVRHQ